jgi:hypothetical protein
MSGLLACEASLPPWNMKIEVNDLDYLPGSSLRCLGDGSGTVAPGSGDPAAVATGLRLG